MFYEWNGYKLRLDAMRIVQLEKALGGSPLTVFSKAGEGTMPSLGDLLTILYYSLLAFNHSKRIEDTYAIYDKFVEEGNGIAELIAVIMEVFRASGMIPKEVEEKN